MKTLARSAAIILLGALLSSCTSGAGTAGPGPGAAGPGAPAPSAGGSVPGVPPAGAAPQAVVDDHWPREVSSGGDHVTMYQPQVDSWDGSLLRAHAAVAVKTGDAKTPPTFGVVWLTVRTEVDRETRLVTLRNGLVTRADFPLGSRQGRRLRPDDREGGAARDGDRARPPRGGPGHPRGGPEGRGGAAAQQSPRDRLLDGAGDPGLRRRTPAYRPVSGTRLERVINTHPLLLKAPAGTHYLHVFDGWMEAPALPGPGRSRARRRPSSPRPWWRPRPAEASTSCRAATPKTRRADPRCQGPRARDPRRDHADRADRDGGGAGLCPDPRDPAAVRQEHHRQRLQGPP